MTLHNNIDFNSKGSKDMATRINKNCHGTPMDIRKNLIPLKVESLSYIFAADSMGPSSFKFLW